MPHLTAIPNANIINILKIILNLVHVLGTLISKASSMNISITVIFYIIPENQKHSHKDTRKHLYAKGSQKGRSLVICCWFWLCTDMTTNSRAVSFTPHPAIRSIVQHCQLQFTQVKRVMLPERFKEILHQFIKKSICKHREDIRQ